MLKTAVAALLTLLTSLVFLSCAPGAGVAESRFAPDDPTHKIVREEDLSRREMIDGYRIRVAAVDTEREALEIEKQVAEAIQEPIYIEFIVDKYMVYAGDCQDRDEANELRDKISAMGFQRVYSVPRKVFRKTEPPKVVSPVSSAPRTAPEATQDINERFDQVIGYRVQIFAARDRGNAERVRSSAMRDIRERIYVVLADDNLYKVQVGDYLARIDAEKMRDKLRLNPNYTDAFIQNTFIFHESAQDTGRFYIQVGAFSTRQSAEDFISTSLNPRGHSNTLIHFDDNTHKVLVGGYSTETEASSVRETLKNSGFEGAWIIRK